MTSCVWRDVQTGERVCLVREKHDCPLRERRPANRCTVVTPHRCSLGRHTPRREFGRAW
jgi:hypothetical protein